VDTGACIKSAAFAPDGRFVVSGGGEVAPFGDGRPDLRLWKVPG
jgi:hypothetical protein